MRQTKQCRIRRLISSRMEINKHDPTVKLQTALAEVGGVRTEVGVGRKLHSTFVWPEKSIQLLSSELHGKERPSKTRGGSLVIMPPFFLSFKQQGV